MGCNCGGKKRVVTATAQPSAVPKPVAKPMTAETGVRQQFALHTPGVGTRYFGSMLELEAAQVRASRVARPE